MPKKVSRPNKNARKEMNTDLTSYFFPAFYEGTRRKGYHHPTTQRMRLASQNSQNSQNESQRHSKPNPTATKPQENSDSQPEPEKLESVPESEIVEPHQESKPKIEAPEVPSADPPESQDDCCENVEYAKKCVEDDWEESAPESQKQCCEDSDEGSATLCEVPEVSEVSEVPKVPEASKEKQIDTEHQNILGTKEPEIPKRPLLSDILKLQKIEEKPEVSKKPFGGFPTMSGMTALHRPLPFPRPNPFASSPQVATSRPVAVQSQSSPFGSGPNGGFSSPSLPRPPNSHGPPPGQLANLRLLAQSLNIAPIPPGQHAHNQHIAQQHHGSSTSSQKTFNSRWDDLAPESSSHTRFSMSSASSSLSPFDQRKMDKPSNPFANRKRYTIDPSFDSSASLGSSGPRHSRGGFDRVDSSFSSTPSWKYTSNHNPINPRAAALERSETSASTISAASGGSSLPTWWKSRSFSSASNYTPQHSKTQFHVVSKRELPRGIMSATSSCHRPKSAMNLVA